MILGPDNFTSEFIKRFKINMAPNLSVLTA